jgi:hypothetical protein
VHSVLGFRHIWNLLRSVEVEISDGHLVGSAHSAPLRMVSSAVKLAAVFPISVARTLLGRRVAPTPELQEAVSRPAAALKNASPPPEGGLAASEFLPARRYGNE